MKNIFDSFPLHRKYKVSCVEVSWHMGGNGTQKQYVILD